MTFTNFPSLPFFSQSSKSTRDLLDEAKRQWEKEYEKEWPSNVPRGTTRKG